MTWAVVFHQDAVFAWTRDAWRLLSCAGDETVVSGWTASAHHAGISKSSYE
ncbi:hypothetical protein ABZV31_29310 [Streptomyces sp. NPDC005202]|uniref:hypothetical protein n=1 Tax=Streptomyces sp. NPDC005202 TaxID=3157021 RepID=UPI0033B3B531